jgi:hypothetical protein
MPDRFGMFRPRDRPQHKGGITRVVDPLLYVSPPRPVLSEYCNTERTYTAVELANGEKKTKVFGVDV